jgi:voltage-gated sodium channel
MVNPDLISPLTGKREKVSNFVEGKRCVQFITALILLNAVTLGLETNHAIYDIYGHIFIAIDQVILSIFILELGLKFYAYRLSFFRSGWNIFDFLIVGIALIPANGSFSILRSLRILRVLRLISVVPQMRRVIAAIAYSIPGMVSVLSVLLLIFYVCSVLATKLFGMHVDPQMQEWFGTIGASAYTLVRIMTLESWSMGIVRPTMEIFPWAWMFFVPFIIVTSFAVLNLFIGIIVDAMQTSQEEPREKDKEEIKEFTKEELNEIHKRFDILHKEIEKVHMTNKAS